VRGERIVGVWQVGQLERHLTSPRDTKPKRRDYSSTDATGARKAYSLLGPDTDKGNALTALSEPSRALARQIAAMSMHAAGGGPNSVNQS
jgi:hypothetical protein